VGDPGAYTNSRPDPRHEGSDSSNPQNQEADRKAAEDAAAYKWHFEHQSEDNPPEVAVGSDADPSNNVHYRFFEKSDGCIFVRRRAAGIDSTQWLRDPKRHAHDFPRIRLSAVSNQPPLEKSPTSDKPEDAPQSEDRRAPESGRSKEEPFDLRTALAVVGLVIAPLGTIMNMLLAWRKDRRESASSQPEWARPRVRRR